MISYEIVAWGRTQPLTLETRREVLRRYAVLVSGRWRAVVRFLQENQATVRELRLDASMSRSVPKSVLAMVELVRDPDAELADQLRAVLAVVVLHLGSVGDAVPGRALIKATDEEIAAAALAVSLDLVAGRSS